MSGSAARDDELGGPAADAEVPPLTDEERRFVDVEVEAALAPYLGTLSDNDVAWMREQLRASFEADAELGALARAACPRNVDESGEVFRAPATPARKA